MQFEYKFDFENTKSATIKTNQKFREIQKMIHIKKEPTAINIRSDLKNLNAIYYNLYLSNPYRIRRRV